MSLHKSGSTHALEKSAIFVYMGFFFPFFNFFKLKSWKVRQWKKEDLEKISEHCTFPGKHMEEKLRGGGDEGREWKRKTWLKGKKKEFFILKIDKRRQKSIVSHFLRFLIKLLFAKNETFQWMPPLLSQLLQVCFHWKIYVYKIQAEEQTGVPCPGHRVGVVGSWNRKVPYYICK